jgi:hypothetical protein
MTPLVDASVAERLGEISVPESSGGRSAPPTAPTPNCRAYQKKGDDTQYNGHWSRPLSICCERYTLQAEGALGSFSGDRLEVSRQRDGVVRRSFAIWFAKAGLFDVSTTSVACEIPGPLECVLEVVPAGRLVTVKPDSWFARDFFRSALVHPERQQFCRA